MRANHRGLKRKALDCRQVYLQVVSATGYTHQIHYYDSVGASGKRYINALIWYLIEKARRENNTDLNEVDFVVTDHGNTIPQQGNGFDCGMFCCLNALFDMEDLPKSFTQEHISNFRLRFCLDILDEKLSYPITHSLSHDTKTQIHDSTRR